MHTYIYMPAIVAIPFTSIRVDHVLCGSIQSLLMSFACCMSLCYSYVVSHLSSVFHCSNTLRCSVPAEATLKGMSRKDHAKYGEENREIASERRRLCMDLLTVVVVIGVNILVVIGV